MPLVKIYTMDGAEAGTVVLSEAVFGVEPNPTVIHDVVLALQAAKRQGNAETKTRKDVSGGGKKPYRQKGTGNARHGSSREPQMRHGGIVFGPHKRSYRHNIPVAIKRKALCCALSDRVRSETLCVLDTLEYPKPKTKPFAQMVGKLSPDGKSTLFVTADVDRSAVLSARNLPRVRVTTVGELNTLDVLNAVRVVVVREAVAKLEARLS
jgi:large subunit ribosomal protein L4